MLSPRRPIRHQRRPRHAGAAWWQPFVIGLGRVLSFGQPMPGAGPAEPGTHGGAQ